MAKSITSIHALELMNRHSFLDRVDNGDLLFCSRLQSIDDPCDPVQTGMWDHVGMIWVAPDASGWMVLSSEDGISCDPIEQYLRRSGGGLALAHRPSMPISERISAYITGRCFLLHPYMLKHTCGYGSSALIHASYLPTAYPLGVEDVPSVQRIWEEESVVVKCGLIR